jgi:signal transduction histidine kinase
LHLNVATTLSMVSAAACLSVAVLGWRLARGPGSRHFRVASLAATADALYCLTDAVLAGRIDVGITVWAGRLSLVLVCAHGAAWLAFLAEYSGRPLSRLERAAVGASVVGAVLALVPGLAIGHGFTERAFPALAVTYRDPQVGPLASPIMAVAYLDQILTIRLALLAGGRNPRARVIVVALLLLCLAALVDWLSAIHVIDIPSLTDLALAGVPLAIASAVAADAGDNARKLIEKSAELDAAREALVERERLAALGELAAIVAHEVRNPVTVVYGALAVLRHKERDPRDTELYAIIEHEANRLRRLVAQLLDVVRPFELRYAVRPVSEVVRDAVALATAGAGGGEIEIELADLSPESVECDDVLLGQALSNLVSNALEAPGRRSAVSVQARLETAGAAPMVRLEILDDGDGVSAEHLPRLFSPFFTTRATGTGLGLAVARRIAEAHGGSIDHVAPADGGACFVLRVPQRAPAPGAQ